MGCNVLIEEAIVKTRMEKTIEDMIESMVLRIEKALQQEEQYQSNEIQEAHFQSMQKRLKKIVDDPEIDWKDMYEPRYWYEKRMLTCKNFQEVLDMKRRSKN